MKAIRRKLSELRKSFDVLAYCDRENRADVYQWFAFTPGVIYPATIERIRMVLAGEAQADELTDRESVLPDGVRNSLTAEARTISALAWGWALAPAPADAWQRAERAKALDLARRWFTQALHVKIGQAVGVHILKDDRFRL